MSFQKQYNALFTKNWRVKNYEKAFPMLIFAAKDGYSHAQNLVGYAFDLGLASAPDAKKAVHWYRKAAEGGSREGLYNLALCHAKGRGIRKDERKAFDLYNQAAEKGHIQASCNLGVMYAEGAGTKPNLVLAVRWWHTAAQRGDAKAQYNLGSAYLDGEGVRSNKRLGASWLQKAAKSGHKQAAEKIRALKFVRPSRSMA